MIDPIRRHRLLGQALYIALFLIILFWRLLPLAPGRVFWPGPDLGLCLTLIWVLRRPDQIPVLPNTPSPAPMPNIPITDIPGANSGGSNNGQ